MNANLMPMPDAGPIQAQPPNKPGRFLTAQWRDLVMLNYEIGPEIVTPYLAPGLDIDFFQGRTFVSMVGFRFADTRVFGWAVPCHRQFPEVNLRFYVKRQVGEETRRGVMFIKELVPRRLVAWVARRFYNENYQTMPMRSEVVLPSADQPGRVEYAWWFGGRWQRLNAAMAGAPQVLVPGTEEEFIAEHYWGYSKQRDGTALEYGVEHPSWRVWPTLGCEFDCDVAGIYGQQFASFLRGKPSSAFVAEGSEVLVRRGVVVVE